VQSADAPGPGHAALAYRSPAEFAAGVVGYLEAGAARQGEPVFVAARPALLDEVRSELDHAGRTAAPANLTPGSLSLPDLTLADLTLADLTLSGSDPGRMLGAIRLFAARHPGLRVHCIQEWAWPDRPGLREAIRVEALIDLALARSSVRVLCGYDASLAAAVLADAECTHPVLLQQGKLVRSVSYRDDAATRAGEGDPLPAPPQDSAAMRFRDDQAAVRAFTASQARSAGLSSEGVTDLLIAVGELAANTLSHTAGEGTLTVWTTPEEIICEVHDNGWIADPLAGTLRPDPESGMGGRGLWVVHQVCDLVEVRTSADSGTTTRVHMNRSARQPGREPGRAQAPAGGEGGSAGWNAVTARAGRAGEAVAPV
jgi:anti-sigma regulatory factor (Ser/Thr protein kinase)